MSVACNRCGDQMQPASGIPGVALLRCACGREIPDERHLQAAAAAPTRRRTLEQLTAAMERAADDALALSEHLLEPRREVAGADPS